jgi:hypothetical protein
MRVASAQTEGDTRSTYNLFELPYFVTPTCDNTNEYV